MQIVNKRTKNICGVSVTGYLGYDYYTVEQVKLEKDCFVKKDKDVIKYHLSCIFKKSLKEDILYNITLSISSNKDNIKKYKLPSISKYKTFKYIDNKTLKEKEIKFEDITNPSLNDLYATPIVSSIFRDFASAYNLSNQNNPINIEDVCFNPNNKFETLLYDTSKTNYLPAYTKNIITKEK